MDAGKRIYASTAAVGRKQAHGLAAALLSIMDAATWLQRSFKNTNNH